MHLSMWLFPFSTGKAPFFQCLWIQRCNSQHRAPKREDSTLLEGQANMGITRSFAKEAQSSKRGGKMTHFTKKFLQLPQLNSPDVIPFVAIRLYLLFHILTKTTQTKIICLLTTLFFFKTVFFMLFLSHFRCIEIATDIRKQLCYTHPATAPQLHKSLPASCWKAET